jgi:hypothetical protein
LPAFRNVAREPAWKRGHTQAMQTPWRDEGAVDETVWRPIAEWVKSELEQVVGTKRQATGCVVMDRAKCRAKGWLVGEYVCVPLGKNAQEDVVWEYAHRLVAWGERVPEVPGSGQVAMHSGLHGRPCVSPRCVRPRHITWGSKQANALEWRDRRKRGKVQ